MRFWSWKGARDGATRDLRPQMPPALEQLEPRILLNADFVGLEPLTMLAAPQNEQAIYVDLTPQDQAIPQDTLPVLQAEPAGSEEGSTPEVGGEDGLLAGLDLGTYSPSDQDFGADAYYADESPKTLESHWKLLDTSSATLGLHRLSVACRGRKDMTIWADGRTDGTSRTPRLQYKWATLADIYDGAYDFNQDGTVDIEDLLILIESWGQDDVSVDIAPVPFGDGVVDAMDLEVLISHWGKTVIDPRLLAHWKLDETEGQTAQDTARDHDATLHGYPSWQPAGGMRDGALQLDGIDDFVSANFVVDPAAGPFSVFAWVNGGAPGQVILSQDKGANWLLAAAQGALATELKSGRGGPLISSAIVTDGAWHRIGFVWDGSNRILYVDDVEVSRDAATGLGGSTGGLHIGVGSGLSPSSFWKGLIDDVRIYNRAVKP